MYYVVSNVCRKATVYVEKMKIFQYIGKIYHVKDISNNKVNKDVQSMLMPLNLMQHIMFCPKYRIKDNVITPNSRISNFVSMIATVVFIYIFIFNMCEMISVELTGFNYFLCVYNGIYTSFGFVMNFMTGVIQTKSNVKFVLTFQNVHRFINNETSFNHIIIWNWIVVLGILGFDVIFTVYLHINIGFPFYSAYTAYLVIFFDCNIIYVIQIINCLENKVKLWNIRIYNSQDIEEVTCGQNYNTRLFQAYFEILQCYDIFKHTFQQFVSTLLSYRKIFYEYSKPGYNFIFNYCRFSDTF